MIYSGPPVSMLDSFCEVGSKLYSGDPFFRDFASQLANRDAELFVVPERGRLAAFESSLRLNGKQVGIIGYYECEKNLETARMLMDAATEWLASRGTEIAIGPMDGSTWHKYRLKLGDTRPRYFLDNYHKPWYVEQFAALEFEPLAKYYSTYLPLADSPPAKYLEGVSIRGFRATSTDEDLRFIYQLSMDGFLGNFLFTPITQSEFLELYRPIVPFVDPRLVVFAENAGNPIGFGFAIPDQMDKSRIVVKSVAVTSDYRGRGIGSLMIRTIQSKARELGYKTAIHAFMHEDNISRRLGSPDEEVIAEYALYSKTVL